MNKRSLRKVVTAPAVGRLIFTAREHPYEYIVAAEIQKIDEEKVLILDVFKREDIKKGRIQPVNRSFISENDYITLDLTSEKTRWTTGKITETEYTHVFSGDRSRNAVARFLKAVGPCKKKGKESAAEKSNIALWKDLTKHQEKIAAARLAARQEKECIPFDQKQLLVPEEPEWWREYVRKDVFADREIMLYKATPRRMTEGYCSRCKSQVTLDQKVIKIRNRKSVTCPECSSPVTLVSAGTFGAEQSAHKWVCLPQKTDEGIVLRFYESTVNFFKQGMALREEYSIRENIRLFYSCKNDGEPPVVEGNIRLFYSCKNDGEPPVVEGFEYYQYKQKGKMRWIPDNNRYFLEKAYIHPEMAEEAVKGTLWQYCSIGLMQKKMGLKEFNVYRYLDLYPSKPYLEFLVKSGMTNLAAGIAACRWREDLNCINEKGKTPAELLNISRQDVKECMRLNPTLSELRVVQALSENRGKWDADTVRAYCERFRYDTDLINLLRTRNIAIGKFISYADRQVEGSDIERKYIHFKSDWKDSFSMGEDLGYDMKDPYYLFPRDFAAMHQKFIEEAKANRDKIAAEKERKRRIAVDRILSEMKQTGEWEMESEALMIRLPKDMEEIIEEGRILHHCVGTYTDLVAKGKTTILFIRKKSAPDNPYFTLEYRDSHIVQCRGLRNCCMPSDVQAFSEAFERRMKKQEEHRRTA